MSADGDIVREAILPARPDDPLTGRLSNASAALARREAAAEERDKARAYIIDLERRFAKCEAQRDALAEALRDFLVVTRSTLGAHAVAKRARAALAEAGLE